MIIRPRHGETRLVIGRESLIDDGPVVVVVMLFVLSAQSDQRPCGAFLHTFLTILASFRFWLNCSHGHRSILIHDAFELSLAAEALIRIPRFCSGR
jgi:hypothetical protein